MVLIRASVETLLATAGDVVPIVLFIGAFQVFVIRQPWHVFRSWRP